MNIRGHITAAPQVHTDQADEAFTEGRQRRIVGRIHASWL